MVKKRIRGINKADGIEGTHKHWSNSKNYASNI